MHDFFGKLILPRENTLLKTAAQAQALAAAAGGAGPIHPTKLPQRLPLHAVPKPPAAVVHSASASRYRGGGDEGGPPAASGEN